MHASRSETRLCRNCGQQGSALQGMRQLSAKIQLSGILRISQSSAANDAELCCGGWTPRDCGFNQLGLGLFCPSNFNFSFILI